MQKKTVLMVVSVSVAILLGFVVGSQRKSDDLTIQVVRTYVVPVDRTDEIRSQLNRLFAGRDGDNYGSAQVFSNGLLIVRASQGYQSGVAHLIEQLDSMKSPPRATIHIDYWIITGQESKASNADEFKGLAPVLTSISGLDGTREFHILEHLSTNSKHGQEVSIKGSVSEARSTAYLGSDTVGVRLEFNSRVGNVRSETEVKPGEFLVMGQNAVAMDAEIHGKKITSVPANVYYVIRAELVH